MKRFIALLIALTLVFSLCACDSEETPSTNPGENETPNVPRQTEPVVVDLEPSGDLGDFAVEIGDCELIQDYEGKPAILIRYTFTNNSEENANAMVNISCQAYQNGIGLDTAFIMDNDSYDAEASMKDIKPGASIEIMEAYLLTSETAPVEFEAAEAFAFSDGKLGKTFYISDETEIVLSTAPEGAVTANVGDYVVSIVSYKLIEDYEGNPAILLELGFTNNSDEADIFAGTISFTAFQDGVELESAYLIGDDSDSGVSQMRHVKPGAGTAVTAAFLLTSETSVVEIEIEEYFSFSDDTFTTEISIAD